MSTDRGAYPDREGTMLEEILRAWPPVAADPDRATIAPAAPVAGSPVPVSPVPPAEATEPPESVSGAAPGRVEKDAATARMLISGALLAELARRIYEYENAITWNTSCTSCAAVLDSCIRETERRETAEAKLAAIAAHCRARMKGPGRSGISLSAATLILGIAEGSDEENQ